MASFNPFDDGSDELDLSFNPATFVFDGEEVVGSMALDTVQLVVTTHRLLVYRPDADESRRLESVLLPNITDVTTTIVGADYGSNLARATVYGLIAVGTGWGLRSMALPALDISTNGGGQMFSQLSSLVVLLRSGLAMVATLLMLAGVLLLLGGLWLVIRYLLSREAVLQIERAGMEPIQCPIGDVDADRVATEIKQAIRSIHE
ncbi:MAG: hypothetical protein ABEH65_13330 [Halobacteriales archaeon]